MTLVHALFPRYLIRRRSGTGPEVVSFGSFSGPDQRWRDLVVGVGAVDPVDAATSVQVAAAIPGVDERWTSPWTAGEGC